MTTYEIEDLLGDEGWLRRIASHLVRDPNTAEDLAQDAALAGLQHGDRAHGRRRWLHGVLRHRARRARRDAHRARSDLRDAGTDASEQFPTDELVERAELQQVIVAQLLELPEGERAALQLVYYADMSLAQAAERMGVAKSTAGERVQRGLARLRLKLDTTYGGDRRAWTAPLVLLTGATRRGAEIEAARSSGAAVGFIACASAVFVASVLVLVRDVEHRSPDHETSLAAPVQRLERAPELPATLESPSAGRGRAGALQDAPTEDRAIATVIGRFLAPDGRGAGGARWTLASKATSAHQRMLFGPGGAPLDLSSVLDATGALSVSFEPHLVTKYTLEVTLDGHAPTRFEFEHVDPETEIDVGTIVFQPRGEIVGRIVDANGRPVPDARWSVRFHRSRTGEPDADFVHLRSRRAEVDSPAGTFRITDLDAGTYIVKATARSDGGGRVGVVVPEGETVHCEIVVDPAVARAISVRLQYDEDRVHPHDRQSPATIVAVDDEGGPLERVHEHIALRWKPPENGHAHVTLHDPRYSPVEIPPLRAGDECTVRLVGNAAIHLDVRSGDGSPVDGFTVTSRATARRSGTYSYHDFVKVLHDGLEPLDRGRLDRMTPGNYNLLVVSGGRVGQVLVEDLAPHETRRVEVVLTPATRLTGTAIDAGGRPLVGATVSIVRPAQRTDLDRETSFLLPLGAPGHSAQGTRQRLARGTVRADGSFDVFLAEPEEAFALLEPGTVRYWSGPFDFEEGGTVHVDFDVPASASLTGSIGLPPHLHARDFELQLWKDAFSGEPVRISLDSLAQFRADDLPPGRFELFLMPVGLHEGSIGNRPIGGQPVGCVTLRPGEHTEVFLSHPGVDLSMLTVRCHIISGRADPTQVAVRTHGSRSFSLVAPEVRSVVDGEAGPFVIHSDSVPVWIEGPDWTSGSAIEVEVRPGAEVWQDVEIDLVEATVVVELDGAVACDRRLDAHAPEGMAHRWIIACDANGRATATLPRGRSTLQFARDDGIVSTPSTIHWPPADGVLRLNWE